MKHRVDEQGFLIDSYSNDYPYFKEDWILIETEITESFIKAKWNGAQWIEGALPEEIAEANRAKVPESISQMKLRKQLILSGISISSIDALIQSLPQPNRDLIYTMWEYAVVFDRANPELNAMAEMLGITQEQLDEIFINGNKL